MNRKKSVENSEDVNRVVLQYRTLAILCNYFNASYCRFLVPAIKYLLGLLGMMGVMIGVRVKVAEIGRASCRERV